MSNGRIAIENGVLVVEGVHFGVTPSVIDAGELNLIFKDNYSDVHKGVDFVAPNGGTLVGNVFGRPSAKPKPWWRFW